MLLILVIVIFETYITVYTYKSKIYIKFTIHLYLIYKIKDLVYIHINVYNK